jgi:3',5'-cyclic AMP phosphodiesterase CpdA
LFTLAHVSDWHTTQLAGASPRDLLNKRFFGWLSWQIRRHRVHQQPVLDALFADLHSQHPDHVAVTGDLTNVALPQEFVRAAELLRKLGSPDWISLIPGNHDSYVAVPRERSWDLWRDYMCSDAEAEARGNTPAPLRFPSLRVRDSVALVGLSSSLPTPLFRATGILGSEQLERLEGLLAQLGDRGLCRVVLVHHPPTQAGISPRRRLTDGPALEAVLERAGAELLLHGHRHRTMIRHIPGPDLEIPVVGVRSASDVGEREEKRAQYHLYRIEGEAGAPRISLVQRGYDPDSGGFVSEGEQAL